MKSPQSLICIIGIIILCSGCVQKTHPKVVTFYLDMNELSNASQVGIRGGISPLSWEETTFMTDDNQDGVYELTLSFKSASSGLEFKFVNHDELFELQNQDNREIPFKYEPETILYEAQFNIAQGVTTLLKPKEGN